MATSQNPTYRAKGAYPHDDRFLFFDGTDYRPYEDKAEVIDTVPEDRRHPGMAVMIGEAIYWFKRGVEDEDLIPLKGMKPVKFIIGDGEAGTPADSTTSYPNTDMAGMGYDDYDLFRNGSLLHPTADYTNKPAGGFDLIAGATFDTNDKYQIR